MLEAFKKKVEAINIVKEVEDAIRQEKPLLIKMNQEQLSKGEKTDSKKIGRYTSRPYIKKRRQMGLQTAYVDLNINQKMYKSIDIFVTSKQTEFFSRVPYAKYLVERYATKKAHIYGLTKDSLNVARAAVQKRVLISIRQKLSA